MGQEDTRDPKLVSMLKAPPGFIVNPEFQNTVWGRLGEAFGFGPLRYMPDPNAPPYDPVAEQKRLQGVFKQTPIPSEPVVVSANSVQGPLLGGGSGVVAPSVEKTEEKPADQTVANTTVASTTGDTTATTEENKPRVTGTSSTTPIPFRGVDSYQYNVAPPEVVPLAYANGQATRQGALANGAPVNFTNNPFFGNGSDPTASAWHGLNAGLDTELNPLQVKALAGILGGSYKNLAQMRALQAQSAVQEAANDPAVWELTQHYMSQGGLAPEEARSLAIGQMLEARGQYGALQMVVPEYAQHARARQDQIGGLSVLGGFDYEAQPNMWGVPSTISAYKANGDGSQSVQLGNTRFTFDQSMIPEFTQYLLSMGPNGAQTLKALANGQALTYEQQILKEQAKQAAITKRQVEVEQVKGDIRSGHIEKKGEETRKTYDHKNQSNTVANAF